jgi:RimJ/RimL family protein N-acetyltransferase
VGLDRHRFPDRVVWNIATGPEVGAWIAAHLESSFAPGSFEAIGLQRAGQLVAGVLYEQWNGSSIVTHIAITGRITPSFVAAIFDYPYNVCGVRKIIAPVWSDNARCIALVTNMGFREEARIVDATPTGDIVLFTLTKTDCRFLEARYGKKAAHAAART